MCVYCDNLSVVVDAAVYTKARSEGLSASWLCQQIAAILLGLASINFKVFEGVSHSCLLEESLNHAQAS